MARGLRAGRDLVEQVGDVLLLEGEPSRNEVYAAVDSEREYQEYVVEPSLAGQDQGLTEHTKGDELVLMKVYLDKAMSAAASRPTKETALDFVRKIVGVGVRCMENHGAPPRMVPREIPEQGVRI